MPLFYSKNPKWGSLRGEFFFFWSVWSLFFTFFFDNFFWEKKKKRKIVFFFTEEFGHFLWHFFSSEKWSKCGPTSLPTPVDMRSAQKYDTLDHSLWEFKKTKCQNWNLLCVFFLLSQVKTTFLFLTRFFNMCFCPVMSKIIKLVLFPPLICDLF